MSVSCCTVLCTHRTFASGRSLDPDDSMYRGKSTKNRADPQSSIITTRSAKKAIGTSKSAAVVAKEPLAAADARLKFKTPVVEGQHASAASIKKQISSVSGSPKKPRETSTAVSPPNAVATGIKKAVKAPPVPPSSALVSTPKPPPSPRKGASSVKSRPAQPLLPASRRSTRCVPLHLTVSNADYWSVTISRRPRSCLVTNRMMPHSLPLLPGQYRIRISVLGLFTLTPAPGLRGPGYAPRRLYLLQATSLEVLNIPSTPTSLTTLPLRSDSSL